MTWKDTTSYSRDDKERVHTTWSLEFGLGRITITCSHIYHRPNWVMHCSALGIKEHPMGGPETPVEDVQKAAIRVVLARIERLKRDVNYAARDAAREAALQKIADKENSDG